MSILKSSRLNVLMFAPVPPPFGGIGNWLNIVKKALSDDSNVNIEVIDIAPKARATEGRSIIQRVADGVRTTSRSLRGFKTACEGSQAVDCIHLATPGGLAVFRDYCVLRKAASKGVPSLYHLHFGRIPELIKSESWEKRMIMRNVGLSKVTVCLDGPTFDSLIACGVSSAKLKKIPNPLPISGLRERAGAESGNGKEKSIIFIGWIVPTKGVGELISAWRRVCKRFPDWHLKIVGPCRDEYKKELLRDLPERVNFVGELEHEEAMLELSRASVLVLPSYTEAFPTVVMEAMACSVPVIATTVGAIPEMIDETRGILVPPRDIDALAHAIEAMLADSAKIWLLGESGYRFVRENYDLPLVINQYKYLWEECAKGRKA